MRKTTTLLLMLVLSWSLAFAQNKTVTGKVTESNGNPISGATIRANGKALGATNAAGTFSVSVPAATKNITISSIGFVDRTVALTGGELTVALSAAEATNMEEVVVTGYTNIQRKKYSGAISSVSANEVRKQPLGSFDLALQGQAAGVSVVGQSGQPGTNGIVRIRGNGSISGSNTPLYIIDGIEITAADFATMNQGDFERVEILKDAVAAGMYGSRGSNGVIVISTKRGKAGQLQLNYDVQLGFAQLPKDRLEMMNSRQKIDYEIARGNPFGWTAAEADSLRAVNFNWRDVFFKTGVSHQHMLSASGGSPTSRFYASLSYFDQEGTVRTTGLKRYTARINVDNNIKNWRFGLTLQGGFSKQIGTTESSTVLQAPLNAYRWSNPYERDIDPRTGEYQETAGAGTGLLTSGQQNGAMELFLNNSHTIQLKGIATSYLEYHFPFLKGLSARTNWGIDFAQEEFFSYRSPRTNSGIARNGNVQRAYGRETRYTGTTSLNYKKDFGEHEIEVGVFNEVVKNSERSFNFAGFGLTNGFQNEAGITAGSASNAQYIPTVGGTGSANGLQSFFALINYGYKDKYYLALVGRRDGSSRFGINNRFANFGSVGVTWVISDENFMQNQNLINDLRLRGSIGTNGNNRTQAGDYPIPTFAAASYNGAGGWVTGTAGNVDYRWETNRTINIGLDFAMFKRRLTGTIELYDRKTKDLFYSLPIDQSLSGFGNIPSNFGSLRNRGIELTLKGDIINTKDFLWTLEGNLTYNQNRILDLPADSLVGGVSILAEGKPVNSFYLVEFAGVNPANGNAMYAKRDKTTTAVYNVNDKIIYGTSDAPWFGSISTSVRYKGFDVSAMVNFFLDRQLYNNERVNITHPDYFLDNMVVENARFWKAPGDITDIPRPSSGTAGGTAPANAFQAITTRFLEDASFWRLRNVTIGYTFSSALLSKVGLRAARIFVQGQNWFTATKFRNFDPEVTPTIAAAGAYYPTLIQTTVGLSIGF